MKKIIIALFSCLVLVHIPTTVFAEKKIYVESQTTSDPSGPRRGTELNFLTLEVNLETCELCFTFIDNVSNVGLTLTTNGVTYEEDELNAVIGQTVIYDLEDYEIGDYDLTIEVDGIVVAIYTVTIEE